MVMMMMMIKPGSKRPTDDPYAKNCSRVYCKTDLINRRGVLVFQDFRVTIIIDHWTVNKIKIITKGTKLQCEKTGKQNTLLTAASSFNLYLFD